MIDMTVRLYPPSLKIWDSKYRLKRHGQVIDHTVEDTWWRVARALASIEEYKEVWAKTFYNAMEGFKFLPAGRIVAGAGTGRNVTLMNCYVMGTIPDDLDGIFTHLKEAALTQQQGGGIGMDFSTLRPKGAPVRGVEADASGPLSFMDCWDAMCRTIMSAGYRRGAMMATMICSHPDVEAFVEAKRDSTKLRMFNLSVMCTDMFMEAVERDLPWNLTFDGRVYNVISARELWNKIMQATYDCAEPGVMFIDRMNRLNNLRYCETISATNPCGEICMGPYAACLLGSVNLTAFVNNPFANNGNGSLDVKALRSVIKTSTRMLDNVNDITGYPLPQQREQALAKRRIGIGVTGLADALVMCGLRYGTDEAVNAAESWISTIEEETYLTSTELAREKGSFPLYDREKYLSGEYVKRLPSRVREAIADHGIRNSLLTSIAPTGTISYFADYISSGIEPIFSYRQERKVLQPDGSRSIEIVEDYAWRLYKEMKGEDPPASREWVTTQELSPTDHLKMQAAFQRHVDHSISKTINLPTSISFDDFKAVYAEAYRLGCKGCTTYRPNDVTGSILSVAEDLEVERLAETAVTGEDVGETAEEGTAYVAGSPLSLGVTPRLNVLYGETHKVRWTDGERDHAYYVTVNHRPTGELHEVFINSMDVEHQAWITALTRMISAVFRRDGDVTFVVDELRKIHDPRGGAWVGGRYVPSLVALIGDVIAGRLGDRSLEDAKFSMRKEINDGWVAERASRGMYDAPRRSCPKCGSYALESAEGCETCKDCNWSKCG